MDARTASTEASGEDCLVAAVAHLSLFAGFWVMGPLAIYFWKRTSSRFVAVHSAQAIALSLVMLIGNTIGTALLFICMYGGMALGALVPKLAELAKLGSSASSSTVGVIAIVVAAVLGLSFVIVVNVLPLVCTLLGAWHAFHGRVYYAPIVGRVARRIVDGNAVATTAP